MKAKAEVSLIKPTKKFLFFFLLAYYAPVGLFMFMLFVLEKEVRGVFVVTWVVALAVLGAYILYGYGRLIVLRVVEKKRAEGVIKALKTDKARKTKSDYHWTAATATASCAFYSLYTLVTAMIVLFSGDVAFKEASYFGFAVATLILAFAVLGIVRYSVRIDRLRKRAAAPDESAVE